jgi:hypothetical protein
VSRSDYATHAVVRRAGEGYTPAIVDVNAAPRRLVLLGHLAITVPAIAAIPLFVRWGLYQFGPSFWPYYVTGGVALAWQWYLIALPSWEGLLRKRGLQENETEAAARQSGLVWPGTGAIGSFAVHTTAAVVCGIHLGPWLLSRWFVWVLPALGRSPTMPRADYWLQHLELVSIIPAAIVGYVISGYLGKLASWSWAVPTLILGYKLLAFTNGDASVFASGHDWSRFSYYFVIQQHMPTFSDFGFSGSDPLRITEQITATAPFYSGVAYSIGALLRKYKVVDRIVVGLRREPERELFGVQKAGIEWIAQANEKPAEQSK